MTISIKTCILAYLHASPSWVWAGTLAREVGRENKTKESVVERRARELHEAGLVDSEYVQVEGVGPRCVRYRLHKDTPQSLAL
jgi:predicted transcriptional regulator